jgi:hypothetical protein
VRFLTGHKKDVRALAYAPDGRLVSGGGDRTVRVWDPLTGECRTTIKAGQIVYAVAASPAGDLVAYAGHPPPPAEASPVTLCDFAGAVVARYRLPSTGTFVEQVPGTWQFATVTRPVARSVWALSFSADGRFLPTTG